MIRHALFVVLVAVLAAGAVRVIHNGGVLRTVHEFNSDRCTLVAEDFTSVEDVVVHKRLRLAFGGSSADLLFPESDKGRKGRIMALSLDTLKAFEVALDRGEHSAAPFRPHGIELVDDEEGGGGLLYVITHRRDFSDEWIEIFSISEDGRSMVLKDAVPHQPGLFTAINNLAVVDGVIFVSNFLHYTAEESPKMNLVETLGQRPWTTVVRCAKEGSSWECTIVADGLVGANGMAVDDSGKTLYVVEAGASMVSVFDIVRTSAGMELKPVRRFSTGQSGCDNVSVDSSLNRILMGCHPKLLQLLGHLKDPTNTKISPSEVIAVPLDDIRNLDRPVGIKQLMMHNGTRLTGSSAAAYDPASDLTLVGTVRRAGLFACKGL